MTTTADDERRAGETRPGLPGAVLHRPRVDQLLERSFARSPAVLISAAPGAGKTVAAQLYSAALDRPTIWVTLDGSHVSPHRLLATLLDALRDLRPAQAQGSTNPAFRIEASLPEAAAVAAGTIQRRPALLVIDECQYLMLADEARHALGTFVVGAPDTLRVLLLSSGALKGFIEHRLVEGGISLVADSDLALTEEENRQLAELLASDTGQAAKVMRATGGWMAGAVFSYRFGLHEQSRTNHLPTVLMSAVLERLPAEDAQFLLDTSIPTAVTREAATALCGDDGHRLWDTVRSRHLPATTMSDDAVVYHSLFRTFLQRTLLSTEPRRHALMVRRYAGHLADSGRVEEAVEQYLSIDARDEALLAFDRAAEGLLARSDWATFLRWAERIGRDRITTNPRLMAGLIRSLFGQHRFEDTISLIRRLDVTGSLRACTEADPALLATAAWALQSDVAEAHRLLDRYRGDYRSEVLRFMTEATCGLRPATPPVWREWGDFERPFSWGLFLQGRTKELRRLAPDDPAAPVLNPNVVLGMCFTGDLADARDSLERVPPELRERPHTRYIEAVVQLAEGDAEASIATLDAALHNRERSPYAISPAYPMFHGWALLLAGRAEEALTELERSVEATARSGHLALLEWGQAFLGCALLTLDRAAEARGFLEECVRSMKAAQRRLYLPLAAAALSEAQARTGDPDAAHEAAELAQHTAAMMGTTMSLLPVVTLFPAIAEREDRHDPSGRRWRRLVVAPSARPVRRPATRGGVHLALQPFGANRDVLVGGVPQHIGRLKIIELTALLVLHPAGVDRAQLQSRLFPDASLRNGGNHFRQVCFKFRQITGLALDRRHGNLVGLPGDTVVDAADLQFEELARSASLVTGQERVERLRRTLALVSGPYLSGSDLAWAEERRTHLAVVEEEARLELVSLLLDLGRPEAARDECEILLRLNRYSDPGYRLLVQIERSIGSETSALAAYSRAVAALGELGLRPGDARRLIDRPRHAVGPAAPTGA
ncbi:hypothetical protein CcI49_20130 [Frankia sp. CcI49]|uniref:AAA family ATPase n=1 Tax=unclassified Frankia TaxID=2632575 RepID=UPI0006CA05ED|nr:MULTISPECIES: AAA family ATPase [unclassified Frankia]KPM54373.1 hypothetical protein ACG83_20825 [Frankia sp. R43]ONH58742.1 hypothetical protein CcI49_20130 [Frankia sp. CcI49]